MKDWINNLFSKKKQAKINSTRSIRQIEFTKISSNWNADPVSPEIELNVNASNLEMDIYLNHYAFDKFNEGDKVKIYFINCAEYSLNTCNDEGYYYGQYRTNPNELPWGEFYEIVGGLDKNYPEPIVTINADKTNKRHFLFFFKDETFECLADDFKLEFYNEKGCL